MLGHTWDRDNVMLLRTCICHVLKPMSLHHGAVLNEVGEMLLNPRLHEVIIFPASPRLQKSAQRAGFQEPSRSYNKLPISCCQEAEKK